MQKGELNKYILLMSPKGDVMYTCRHTRDKFALNKESLKGLNLRSFKHQNMPDGPINDLFGVVSKGKPWLGVIQLQAGSDELWVSCYVLPVMEQGQVAELHCIMQEADNATLSRARQVYGLRKQGKMPLRLRLPIKSTWQRLYLVSVLAIVPISTAAALAATGWILGISFAISLALLFFAQYLVMRPFNRLVSTSKAIVYHPIKQIIYTNTVDDIGQLHMVISMQQEQTSSLTYRLQNTSDLIFKRANSTVASMEQLTQALNQQTNGLDELSNSSTSLQENAQVMSAETTSSKIAVEAALAQIELGQTTLKDAIKGNHLLAEKIQQNRSYFLELEASSNNIGDVLVVIQNVAEQTNLLALNAAIEAARAGEAGRGFAVVADEVRSLAAETQNSAVSIQTMIEGLQKATQQILSTLEQEQEISDSSVKQIDAAGEAFNSILKNVDLLLAKVAALEEGNKQQTQVAEIVDTQVAAFIVANQKTSNEAKTADKLNQEVARMANSQNLLLSGLAQA